LGYPKLRKFLDLKFVPEEKRQAFILVFILFWSVALGWGIHQWVLGSVTIQGNSMTPTLAAGERYFFHRWVYLFRDPERGEIVVLRDPYDSQSTIKRVVGLPGEFIQLKDGRVYVNQKQLKEPYLGHYTKSFGGALGDKLYQIGDHHYFVLGDNRWNSRDSRMIGAVDRDLIFGKINHPSMPELAE